MKAENQNKNWTQNIMHPKLVHFAGWNARYHRIFLKKCNGHKLLEQNFTAKGAKGAKFFSLILCMLRALCGSTNS
jgi:hypothetical protein